MRKMTSPLVPAMALTFALAGCGGGGNYPSLAQRPAELNYTTQAPAPVVPAAIGKPEPAIVHQVETLRSDAAKSSETFMQRANEAEHLARAAHGSPLGSEAWSATTVAMAALDSARSDTAQSLGELDALQAKMAVTAADSNNPDDKATFALIARADAAVNAMMDAENARIAALHAMTGD
jgi:predicted component of type VI protein secretion system